jgi:hypothetical protein
MVMLLMLDKEIMQLKKIKLKPNQLFHHAMERMVSKVLTALRESHSSFAQET